MSKHTPGPWKVDKDIKVRFDPESGQKLPDETRYFIYQATNKVTEHFSLAYVNSYAVPEAEANAAHIVKCVNMHDELVECLKLASYEVWEMSNGLAKGGPAKREVEKLSARISDVLAKAEGRDE